MTREIKFRLWNPKENVLTAGLHLNIILLTTDSEFVNDFNKSGMIWMQYTGFKDSKGIECYEGDIKREEIEEDDGDRRFYYVCVWVKE